MKRMDENIPQVNKRIRLSTPRLEDNYNKTFRQMRNNHQVHIASR